MFIESHKYIKCPTIDGNVQITLVHAPHKNIPRPDKHFSSCDSADKCGAAKRNGINVTYDWNACPFKDRRF